MSERKDKRKSKIQTSVTTSRINNYFESFGTNTEDILEINKQLSGITDNNERNRLVNSFLDKAEIDKNVKDLGISKQEANGLFLKQKWETDSSKKKEIQDTYLKERSEYKEGGRLTKKHGKFELYDGRGKALDNYDSSRIHKKPSKIEEAKNSAIGFGKSFLGNMFSSHPDNLKDALTASSHGVQLRNTTLGGVGKHLGLPEVTGFNPLSGQNINIDYLHNRISKSDRKVNITTHRDAAAAIKNLTKDSRSKNPKYSDEHRQSLIDSHQKTLSTKNKDTGFIKRSFNSLYNNVNSYIGSRKIEKWKQDHINETAKYVRQHGGNINPFDLGENQDYLRQQKHVEALRYNHEKDQANFHQKGVSGPIKPSEELIKAEEKLQTLTNNEKLSELKTKYTEQLSEVKARILDSKNQVKSFFNPTDQNELRMLKEAEEELTERIRRIDGNYGSSRVQTDAINLPSSPQNHPELQKLYEERANLNHQLNNVSSLGLQKEADISKIRKQINQVEATISSKQDIYDNAEISKSAGLGSPSATKTYKPTFGTSGYGLGFSNALKASSTEHLVRGLHYLNPLGAGGASAMQAMAESFGLMNRQQRDAAKQARGLGRIGSAMVPGLAAAQVGLGIYNKEDAGQIIEDMFSVGTSLAGWRTGSAFGGAIGGMRQGNKMTIRKGLGLGLGGLTGMVGGYMVGSALIGGIRDVSSNESEIRNFAKKISTKEMYVKQMDTQQSLTARMASLNKLSKSGLNDRGLLLGNEATILKTGG